MSQVLSDTLDFTIRVARLADDNEVILLRVADGVRAYLNRCPHAGAILDLGDGSSLEDDGLLHCGLHGAEFSPEDGHCVAGPDGCRSLWPVPIRIEGDSVLLAGAPLPPPRAPR